MSMEGFASILQKLRTEKAPLQEALKLYNQMCGYGIDANNTLSNHMVCLFVEVETTYHHAQRVFDKLVLRDESSWNALIIGYVKAGDPHHALCLYHKLKEEEKGYLSISLYAFVALLKACSIMEDIEMGRIIHSEIDCNKRCFDAGHPLIGRHLVEMYAKCGYLAKAQELHDGLLGRDVVSWTLLISGYVEDLQFERALKCSEEMYFEGISPNSFTVVCFLKACASIESSIKGHEMHAQIIKNGFLEGNLFLESALVNMYAKCGDLGDARNVFDKLLVQNEVSWNALIAGYCDFGFGNESLICFEEMEKRGIFLSIGTFVSALKACSISGSRKKGEEIHSDALKKGLEENVMVDNVLIDMYVKCGVIEAAENVFDRIIVRDVISWTTLLMGYLECGNSKETLACFDCALYDGVNLNDVAYVCGLKACSSIQALTKGREIHSYVVKKGMERETSVTSSLIDMYGKCGSLQDAKNVFDDHECRTTVTWNALIVSYMEHSYFKEAFNCCTIMQNHGISLDAITFSCKLKTCASKEIPAVYTEITMKSLEREVMISNVLIDMYAKCGMFLEARAVLDKLPTQTVIAWTTLIAGLTDHGYVEEALHCFQEMQVKELCLNSVTYICISKAFAGMRSCIWGQQLHIEISRKGLERDILVGSALVDMYFKCHLLVEAQDVFNNILDQDVVLWNALIVGYTENGFGEEALKAFEEMQREGIPSDSVTIMCCLKACGSIRNMDKGKAIHVIIAKMGLERETLLGNTLIDIYAKHGFLKEAQQVFDMILLQDVVSWNSLIAGYVEHGFTKQAADCLQGMQQNGILPDVISFACIIKTCCSIGSAEQGHEIYQEIVIRGLEAGYLMGNMIIDMFVAYGSLLEARNVFEKLPVQTLASWNALLAGYAELGDNKNVCSVFDKIMRCESPDLITFVTILKACSHLGLVDEGYSLFNAMETYSGLGPGPEHYSCFIDLLGRVGRIDDLVILIERMPFHPSTVVWHTLLAGCRRWDVVKLARYAFKHIVCLNENYTTAYVCMLNICAESAVEDEN